MANEALLRTPGRPGEATTFQFTARPRRASNFTFIHLYLLQGLRKVIMFTFVLFNHSFGKFWKKHVFTAFYFTERYFNFTLDILLLQEGNIINNKI